MRLILSCAVLSPLSHCSDVMDGSQRTLVSGNKSSWKNCFCENQCSTNQTKLNLDQIIWISVSTLMLIVFHFPETWGFLHRRVSDEIAFAKTSFPCFLIRLAILKASHFFLLFQLLVDWENIILMSCSSLFPSSDTDEFENIRTHNLNTISIAIALSNDASS